LAHCWETKYDVIEKALTRKVDIIAMARIVRPTEGDKQNIAKKNKARSIATAKRVKVSLASGVVPRSLIKEMLVHIQAPANDAATINQMV
jgi:hypothetical protein